jgi:hypothetical protein
VACVVLVKEWLSGSSVILKVTLAAVGVEVVPLKSIRHRELTYVLHLFGLSQEQVFVCKSVPDRSSYLIDQISFVIHKLLVLVSVVTLLDDPVPVHDSTARITVKIAGAHVLIELSLINSNCAVKPLVELVLSLDHLSIELVVVSPHSTD